MAWQSKSYHHTQVNTSCNVLISINHLDDELKDLIEYCPVRTEEAPHPPGHQALVPQL